MNGLRILSSSSSVGIRMAYENWSSKTPVWKRVKQDGLEIKCRNGGV